MSNTPDFPLSYIMTLTDMS